VVVSSTPPTRSVKIASDERGGWSSDRPRRDSGPERPADISTRCRVLDPSDRLRYSPGSLLVVLCAVAADRDAFVERVIEERGAVLSLDKVRGLLAGRVDAGELEAKATEILEAAVSKRLTASESVVLAADGLDTQARERYVRMAASLRRPRHALLLESPRDAVADEDRATLNDLRNAVDSGGLGAEGFQTAVRVGGEAIAELKRVVFRPPPSDDD
jgi:hypothetical protein